MLDQCPEVISISLKYATGSAVIAQVFFKLLLSMYKLALLYWHDLVLLLHPIIFGTISVCCGVPHAAYVVKAI